MNKTPDYQAKANTNYRKRHKLKQYNRNVQEEFIEKLDEVLRQLRDEYKNKTKEVNK